MIYCIIILFAYNHGLYGRAVTSLARQFPFPGRFDLTSQCQALEGTANMNDLSAQ